MCYGTRKCRHCYGTGFELTSAEKAKDVLLWLWFLSWFAFLGAFLYIGVWEYRIAASLGRHASRDCLVLLIVTVFLWILFFAVHTRARSNRFSLVVGTVLAVFTLAGIFFFAYIAPNAP